MKINLNEILPDVRKMGTAVPKHVRYEMANGLRGFALIFSHRHFADCDGFPPRIGVDYDIEQLGGTLQHLGFTVRNYYDLTLRQTFYEIDKMKQQETAKLNDSHCLMVFVLTYGISGRAIMAHDKPYDYMELVKEFKAEKFPALAGKPKLFFIQTSLTFNEDGMILAGTAPTDEKEPHLLIGYNSGSSMYRNKGGSLFIRELAYSLELCGKHSDSLQDAIKTVVKRCTAGGSSPIFFSTLTRDIVFTNKLTVAKPNAGSNFFVIFKRVMSILAVIWTIQFVTRRIMSGTAPVIITKSKILDKFKRL